MESYANNITIPGGNITAEGGAGGGAGIGGGGGTISSGGYAHTAVQITISTSNSPSKIIALGGAGGGAGIGGGLGGRADMITFSGDDLTASGKDGGAGIGGGSGADADTIAFTSGTAVANGGGSSNGGGAGVGGGANGNASNISFSGGSLNAIGGKGGGGGAGAKIGGGGTAAQDGSETDVYFKALLVGTPVKAELYTFTLIDPGETPVTLKICAVNESIGYSVTNVKTDAQSKVYFHLPPFSGTAWVLSTEEDRLGYINKSIDSDGRAFELYPVMLPGYSPQKDDSADSSAPQPAYNSTRLLKDPATQVSVSGAIQGQAALNVIKDPALSGYCSQSLASEKDKGGDLGLYDISLSNNELLLRFPVPQAYNGQSVEVLHCTGKGVETLSAVAQDGIVQVQTASLGSFLLRTDKASNVPTVMPVTEVPATGGAGPAWALILTALTLAFILIKRRTE